MIQQLYDILKLQHISSKLVTYFMKVGDVAKSFSAKKSYSETECIFYRIMYSSYKYIQKLQFAGQNERLQGNLPWFSHYLDDAAGKV